MRTEILYVELKIGHSGPAWIGYGYYSKSGQTVYFDGKVLKKKQGVIGNHFDIESGDEYWISGVKKNGQDRHWAGSGKVYIDNSVIEDYLKIIEQTTLPKNSYIVVDLDNEPNKQLSTEIENAKSVEKPFDRKLLYKKTVKELTDEELAQVLAYYNDLDLASYPLKSRKYFIERMRKLSIEIGSRGNLNQLTSV